MFSSSSSSSSSSSFSSDFSYFLLILNKKKNAKRHRFNGSNGSTNWVVTEPWIDKNWKLEDWIDKIEMKKCESKRVSFAFLPKLIYVNFFSTWMLPQNLACVLRLYIYFRILSIFNTHIKFHVNQMLFTIQFINLIFMHNFRLQKLEI